jgi:hypothetical protein
MLSVLFRDRERERERECVCVYPLETMVVVRDCYLFTYALVLIHVTSVRLRVGYLRLQTHTQNVITLQQWLHERASILRYTYIVCLVHY